MNKDIVKKRAAKIAIYLLGIVLILWAYYSNIRYNERQGVDAVSGATQIYEQ